MKIVFDLKNVSESLLVKMPSGEKLVAYKKAKEEFEKNGSKGTAPTAPELEKYKPLQLVELVVIKVLRDNYKTVRTDQINHLLGLFSLLSKQAIENAESFDLPETDIRFIRKAFSKTTWPTDNEELLKFILKVEKSFTKAIEKKG